MPRSADPSPAPVRRGHHRWAALTLAVVGALLIAAALASQGFGAGPPQPQTAPPATVAPTSGTVPGHSTPERHPPSATPNSTASTPSQTPSVAGRASTPAPQSLAEHRRKPRHIDIPAIGVDASMVSLGLTSDGAVAVPSFDHADDVGWYRYSPSPGDVGPSVLIGHIDSPAGPAVFYRLGAIKRGNTIRVTRADGMVAVFTVTKVTRYPKSTFPINEIYGDTERPTLRLITCGGPYVRSEGGYQDNTVVFATLEQLRNGSS